MKNVSIHLIRLVLLFCIGNATAHAQQVLRGEVYDEETGTALAGVSVKTYGERSGVLTDSLGRFRIVLPEAKVVLRFDRMGYRPHSGEFQAADHLIRVPLRADPFMIEEVEINTGYQRIPRERATGSFAFVGEAELASLPGRSILEKLDGVMPGLQFDNRNFDYRTPESGFSMNIRGINTFSGATSRPLVILDNFPYEGDLENINPNDVESVTLMRDAAATSIWGARAGNGVLVITLKRPDASGKTVVSWSSNTTITPKPDLYYQPAMSSSEFVDVELFLYGQNFYRSALTGSNVHRTIFSPVVQASHDRQLGTISQEELDAMITDARSRDYRQDMLSHFYRNAVEWQHHLSVSKKTGNHALRFSAGMDKQEGRGNMVGERTNRRLSFSLGNSYQFTPRFYAEMNIGYAVLGNDSPDAFFYPINPGGGKAAHYPYLRLVDEKGEGLPIPRDLNPRYVDTVAGGSLLDWTYNPMRELTLLNNRRASARIHPTLLVRYKVVGGLDLEALYSGEFEHSLSQGLDGMDSYRVRNEVNRFSRIDGNQVVRPFPIGDIYSRGDAGLTGQKLRLQAKMDEATSQFGRISWIVGGEVSNVESERASQIAYGYDPYLRESATVDHVTRFPLYLGGTGTIPGGQGFGRSVRRLISFYGNAAYSYDQRYTLSVSARRDASNVFGVKSNERWNPLWSVGFSWNLANESFMESLDWLSALRIRVSHGHSGNLGGGTTSDRVVINYGSTAPITNLPFASILYPPNPSLKWENVQMNNYALDYGLFGGKLSGSVEYYRKVVTDLISSDPLDKTTGFTDITKNVGGIAGEGLELSLDVRPLTGAFGWHMGFSFSYVRDWVTVYRGNLSSSTSAASRGESSILPFEGKPLMAVYSYRYAGLDPQNGNPRGYLGGEISTDYAKLLSDSIHNLVYHGPGRPPYFGFFNNTFRYKGFSLALYVSFRAGHYFRRSTVKYAALFNSWDTHGDYAKRWQQPGDEQYTDVPSMTYPANASRDNFYSLSEATIERGDILRLQRARLSYRWSRPFWKVRDVELGVNVNNIGILWKAARSWRDPDYHAIPPARITSANLRVQF